LAERPRPNDVCDRGKLARSHQIGVVGIPRRWRRQERTRLVGGCASTRQSSWAARSFPPCPQASGRGQDEVDSLTTKPFHGHAIRGQEAVLRSPLFEGRFGRIFRNLPPFLDRKSTRLNSSHVSISYAVFCLKKKNSYKTITCASSSAHSKANAPNIYSLPFPHLA